jgi:hypothetical protein
MRLQRLTQAWGKSLVLRLWCRRLQAVGIQNFDGFQAPAPTISTMMPPSHYLQMKHHLNWVWAGTTRLDPDSLGEKWLNESGMASSDIPIHSGDPTNSYLTVPRRAAPSYLLLGFNRFDCALTSALCNE